MSGELDFKLTLNGKDVLVSRGAKLPLNRINPERIAPRYQRLCPGATLFSGTLQNVVGREYNFHVDKPQFNISFCLSGLSHICFYDKNIQSESILHSPSVCTISYLESASGIWRPSDDTYTMVTVSINPYAFTKVWEGFGNDLPEVFRPFAEGRRSKQFFFNPSINPAIQRVLGSLIQNPVAGPGDALMLECKTIELLVRLTALLAEESRTGNKIPLSSKDMERIHAARTILEVQFEKPPTLSELARQIGLNEFKLKRGFRQVFGTTPFSHLRSVRLEKARGHLETGEMNVYESCIAVGYSSLSNFISLFKREFGITPGKVLQCAMRVENRN